MLCALSGIINAYKEDPSVVDDIKDLVNLYVTVSLLLHFLFMLQSVGRQTLSSFISAWEPMRFCIAMH